MTNSNNIKNMHIIFVLKDKLNCRPPILSTVMNLVDFGVHLTLCVLDIEKDTKSFLESKGVKIRFCDIDNGFKKIPKIGSAISWLKFRHQVTKILRKESFDYVWMASADATLALGTELLKYPYILQIMELYDTEPRYRENLRVFMRNAKLVIVPEEVRAHVFRAWYQLKETPIILPNKPYYHPRKRNLPITNPSAAAAFAKIPKGSKIVFFQGRVGKERDIKPIAKAIKELGGPWVLAVQCPACDRQFVEEDLIYYIPFVPAPCHLEITSHVDIGLVAYNHIHLNNEFCAPNKIYEYSGFGIPILANDVYGLVNTIEKYHAGELLNIDCFTLEDFKNALQKIQKDEVYYQENATRMFDAVNLHDIFVKILQKIANR